MKAISQITNVIWSGPGWDNYTDALSAQQNIDCIYGSNPPDIVIGFEPYKINGFENISIPKCVRFNELHAPDGNRQPPIDLIKKYKIDLVICHHLNEMNILIEQENVLKKCPHVKMHYIPHGINNDIFKDYQFNKEYDVLVAGSLVLSKYGFRKRLADIIQRLSSKYVCHVFQHPGEYLPDAHTDRYALEFAHAINKSKIVLTCSSDFKCAFAKYIEVPMCGTALMADIPDERQEFFRSFVLEINPSDTDEQIMNKIDRYLNNKDELSKIIQIGLEASSRYTSENYAKEFVSIVSNFLKSRTVNYLI